MTTPLYGTPVTTPYGAGSFGGLVDGHSQADDQFCWVAFPAKPSALPGVRWYPDASGSGRALIPFSNVDKS